MRSRHFPPFALAITMLAAGVAAGATESVREFARGKSEHVDELEDYTERLHAQPGLVITVPIWDAKFRDGKTIGDFDNVFTVTKSKPEEISLDYSFSSPADIQGNRLVSESDLKRSHKIQMYFTDKGSGDYEPGSTPYIRISDDLFKQIKSGKPADIEMDTPANGPRSIKVSGVEKLPVLIDERDGAIRTVRAECDNGWLLWILDNPDFPMVVKGQLDYKFGQPMFSHADITGKEIVKQLSLGKEVTTHAVLFGFNSVELNSESKPILEQLREYLKENPGKKLEIQGHTDNIGSAKENLDLSKRRAQAVKEFICQSEAVAFDRVTTEGLGYSRPTADNSTATGRQRNRRVIFKIIE